MAMEYECTDSVSQVKSCFKLNFICNTLWQETKLLFKVLLSRHKKTAAVCRRDGGVIVRMRTVLFKAVFLFHKHLLNVSLTV